MSVTQMTFVELELEHAANVQKTGSFSRYFGRLLISQIPFCVIH